MGSRVFSGTTQYLNVDSALGLGVPITLGCWQKVDTHSTDGTLVGLFDKDAAAEWFFLGVDSSGDMQIEHRSSGTGATQNVRSTTTVTTGAWESAVGVFETLSARRVYLNGTNKGTGSGTEAAPPIDRLSIGRMGDSSPSNYHDGKIQYVFIWNVALSDAEVADFHAGNIPQEANVVEWWEFDGSSPEVGQIASTALAVTGATYDGADSPPVTYGGGGAEKILTGTSAGSASVTGSVVRDRAISGQANGALFASGTLVRDRALAGQTAGVLVASGTLIKESGEEKILTGQADGALAAIGLVVRDRSVSGLITGVLNASGSVVRDRALIGQTDGLLVATGAVTKGSEVLFAGDVMGLLSSTAALVRDRAFVGQSNGLLIVSASLLRDRNLVGQSDGILTSTGTLARDRPLVGTSNGVLSVSGNLIIFVPEGDAALFRSLLSAGQ